MLLSDTLELSGLSASPNYTFQIFGGTYGAATNWQVADPNSQGPNHALLQVQTLDGAWANVLYLSADTQYQTAQLIAGNYRLSLANVTGFSIILSRIPT